jgi:hypothetical protein
MATKKNSAPSTVVETVQLDTLREHPQNPRRGDVESIKASVSEFGNWRALVVQKSTRHVLIGNHLMRALIELGHKSAPAIIVDVDDTTARRILLTDNRLSDLADYDPVAMLEVIASIKDAGGSLNATGLEDSDVDAIADLIKKEGDADLSSAVKEWSADTIDMRAEFHFRAPAELQAKIRAMLQREFPGVEFRESINQ